MNQHRDRSDTCPSSRPRCPKGFQWNSSVGFAAMSWNLSNKLMISICKLCDSKSCLPAYRRLRFVQAVLLFNGTHFQWILFMPFDWLKKQSGCDDVHRNSANNEHTALSSINAKKEWNEMRQKDWPEPGDCRSNSKRFISSLFKVSVHCEWERWRAQSHSDC